MVVYSLYIINKAGGLIYQKEFVKTSQKITGNLYLRLGSMFHGLHAISAQLSPVDGESGGIEVLEADTFKLQSFLTPTATKFFLIADPTQANLDVLLKTTIYELYSDYVLKNPFYEFEMPIRVDLFDYYLEKAINEVNSAK